MTTIGDWLKQQAQADLDEHVSPEIQALVKRGNITVAEAAELRCNSWEWEEIVLAMTDEAFVERMEHAITNCAVRKRPFTVYDEAVVGLYAPELLRRFNYTHRAARTFEEVVDNVRVALGLEVTHYLVVADDVRELVEAVEKDDGSALEVLEKLRERSRGQKPGG